MSAVVVVLLVVVGVSELVGVDGLFAVGAVVVVVFLAVLLLDGVLLVVDFTVGLMIILLGTGVDPIGHSFTNTGSV